MTSDLDIIVADLKAGHRVTVDKAHIDDWLWTHSDGINEGNERGAILEQIEVERRVNS